MPTSPPTCSDHRCCSSNERSVIESRLPIVKDRRGEQDSVVCPLHAWRFALVTGQAQVGDCDIAVHPCRLDAHGNILVTVPVTPSG